MKKLMQVTVVFALCFGASNFVLASSQDGVNNSAKVGALVAADLSKSRGAGVDPSLMRQRFNATDNARPEPLLQNAPSASQAATLMVDQPSSDNPMILLAGLGLIGVIAFRRLSS